MSDPRIERTRGVGKLLVTGSPGWLADAWLTSLAREALPGITSVRCLVAPHAAEAQIVELGRRRGLDLEIVRGDLTDPESLTKAVVGVDAIMHAAAIIHVRRIEDYYAVNSQGTRDLARAADRAGVRRFVYVSSNAAGGKSESRSRLMRESDPDRPLSHYGRSKLLGEKWLFDMEGPMERVALRPCMFYGPPVPPRHVDVYRRILHGRMPLVGGGDYARSLTYIDHLIEALRLALTSPKADGQAYYVADREPYTTKRVVTAMAEALGTRARFIRLPAVAATAAYHVDNVISMYDRYEATVHLVGEANWNVGVSVDKARTELGYDPKVTIEEGMRRAVAWCREEGLL
jgi:nucleoside-diphosphate-sugar epimerase